MLDLNFDDLAFTRPCERISTQGIWDDMKHPVPRTREMYLGDFSRWEAAPECKQQLGRSLNANLPPEQRPYDVGFLAQKSQPGLAIGNKSQIGLPIVAVGSLQTFRLESSLLL